MDTNFQTSFIPKKPLTSPRQSGGGHVSFASLIAWIIFLASFAALGGMYFYKQNLVKSVAEKNKSLEVARNSFEPTLIAQLKTLNRRLDDSNKLLSQHISISPIFAELQKSTLKSVQFTKFSYSLPSDAVEQVTIHMNGRARDYSAIALESDEIAKNKNIHNPLFSNLSLETTTGIVSFDLTFSVSPELVHYVNAVGGQSTTNNTSSVDTSSQSTPTTSQTPQTVPSTSPSTSTNSTSGLSVPSRVPSSAGTPTTGGTSPSLPTLPTGQSTGSGTTPTLPTLPGSH